MVTNNQINLKNAGMVSYDGAGVFAGRTITAGSGVSVSNGNGIAGNPTISASASVPTTFTGDVGTANPALNNINLVGTSAQGLSTSASGSTVTFTNANATTTQKGVAALATNAEAIAGTDTAKIITADDLKAKLGAQTNHGVALGQTTTSALAYTAAGATNTVLLGNTGADPSFGTVPNGALTNSSITLNNGNNITITGSPVSLGGAATVNVSGTTNHSLQVGNATGSLTSLTAATNGQLPIGSTGADPVIATLTAGTGVSIVNAAGSITINASSAVPTTFTTDSGVATPSSNNLNVLGSGSIATSGSGATVTTALTGLTNHNVLIGAGTSTITKVAPSATSGIPLISQGASADPTFGTAVVAGGGTGNTTFTAYSVITAGTTATGAFQNVSGVGSSGQVLTSNGAGTLPTWQASGGSSFNPLTTVQIVEDFLGFCTNNAGGFLYAGNYGWYSGQASTFSGSSTSVESGHPGVISVGALLSGNFVPMIMGRSNSAPFAISFVLGGGAITANWIIKTPILSVANPRYIFRFGLGDTISNSDQANGVYFEYSDNINSGNWVGKTASSSVRSTANGTIAAETTSWHNFQISINAAATSISYFIDGVEIANSPLTTNIPTAQISPFFFMSCTAGTTTTNSVLVDLFYLTQTLTSSR